MSEYCFDPAVSFSYDDICLYSQVSGRPEVVDDPCKDTKYREREVDTMRAQKDEVSE